MNDILINKINGKDLIFNLKMNKHFLEMYFIVIVSLIVGVLVSKNNNTLVNSYLSYLMNNYFCSSETFNFFNIFINSFSSSIIFLSLFYVLGSGVFGCFFVPVILFLRASGYGVISGYLYSNYHLKGVCFYLLTVVPGAFIMLLCLMFAAKESFVFSSLFFKSVKKESKPSKFSNDFKLYSMRFLVMFLFTILSSLIDSVTGIAFSKFFTF